MTDIVENRLYRLRALLVGITSAAHGDAYDKDGTNTETVAHLASAARDEVSAIMRSLDASALNSEVRTGGSNHG